MNPLHVALALGGLVLLVGVVSAVAIRRAMSRETQRMLDEAWVKRARQGQERTER
jgi:hypothetical protein